MKTWNKTISLLRNDEQKIVANGYPDLRIDRILGGSIEGLDVVTAIELDSVPVTFVAVDTLLELVFVKERHDLSEDCFSFVLDLRMAP